MAKLGARIAGIGMAVVAVGIVVLVMAGVLDQSGMLVLGGTVTAIGFVAGIVGWFINQFSD
ncbi:hypothetical protein [Microbacterium sp. KNMS]